MVACRFFPQCEAQQANPGPAASSLSHSAREHQEAAAGSSVRYHGMSWFCYVPCTCEVSDDNHTDHLIQRSPHSNASEASGVDAICVCFPKKVCANCFPCVRGTSLGVDTLTARKRHGVGSGTTPHFREKVVFKSGSDLSPARIFVPIPSMVPSLVRRNCTSALVVSPLPLTPSW